MEIRFRREALFNLYERFYKGYRHFLPAYFYSDIFIKVKIHSPFDKSKLLYLVKYFSSSITLSIQ